MSTRPPLRIAFLDSWVRGRAEGTGSAVAIEGLAAGLARLGHRVERIGPRRLPRGGLLGRVVFNAALPRRLDPGAWDLVVGFDLDGCFLDVEGARHVTALKGVAADEMRFEAGLTRLRFRVLSRLERRAARTADRVVVTSRYARRVATGAYGLDEDRVRVVPEGIDLEPWEEDAARAGGASGPGAPPGGADDAVDDEGPGAFRILTVARQYPRKNTDTLLRALPRVRRSVPGAGLRVVGGGPRLPALRRLAADLGLGSAVAFLGEVDDPREVRAEYRRADVFCLPSLQEGFGIVFLEAMAAGLPIVAGRAAAVPEVVPDGEVGVLVPPRDDAALADALARLAREPETRRRMGGAGRDRVRAFTWTEVARTFLAEVGLVPRRRSADLGA